MANFKISLCLSDFTKYREEIIKKTRESNDGERKYITIFMNERKEPKENGETHYLTLGKNELGEKMYCGSAMPSTEYGEYTPKAEEPFEEDKLPF